METNAFDRKFCHYDVNEEKSEYGYNSVYYGNCRVVHWNAGEFACHERDCEFERLQFAELPFSHKPHCDQKKEIYDYAPYKQT